MNSVLPAPRTLRLSATSHKEEITQGRFSVSRYHGTFNTHSLQVRANLGYWYARCMGAGHDLTGEGSTPEGALADLKKRAAELRDEVTRLYSL